MKFLINGEGYNSLIEGKFGYILFNKNDLFIGKSIEKYGEFSDHEVQFLQKVCKRGDTVIEIGANIGSHTLALSQMVGEKGLIYAYEPQRMVFQTLCANIALNSIENVVCRNLAISSEQEILYHRSIRYDLPGNFGGIEMEKIYQQEEIQANKLDNLLCNIPQINLIKIDAEGMEKDILSGASELIEKHAPILYIENDRVQHSFALLKLVRAFGYRAFWHFPPLFNEKNYASCHENIFLGIVSINVLCHKNPPYEVIDSLQEILDDSWFPGM